MSQKPARLSVLRGQLRPMPNLPAASVRSPGTVHVHVSRSTCHDFQPQTTPRPGADNAFSACRFCQATWYTWRCHQNHVPQSIQVPPMHYLSTALAQPCATIITLADFANGFCLPRYRMKRWENHWSRSRHADVCHSIINSNSGGAKAVGDEFPYINKNYTC